MRFHEVFGEPSELFGGELNRLAIVSNVFVEVLPRLDDGGIEIG